MMVEAVESFDVVVRGLQADQRRCHRPDVKRATGKGINVKGKPAKKAAARQMCTPRTITPMCSPGTLTWGLGGVLGVFWGCSGGCSGGVLGVFWGCSGGILGESPQNTTRIAPEHP